VYRVSGPDGELKTLILPVCGYGLWSTLYGFLALEGDLRTVQGLKFYQHAETPGLGGEVDNPKWRALWRGKVVFDEQWRPRVELVKGSVDPSAPDAAHKIDGLAGATLTSRGVTNLLNFWLGDEGYAPYLARLRQARS
jgi:Na+-transporting NADH:ubiquinone oxidoreductase subunit C